MLLQQGASAMRRSTPALLRLPTRSAVAAARNLSLLPRRQPPPALTTPPRGSKPAIRAPPLALASLFEPSYPRRRPHSSPNAAPEGEVSDAEYHLRLGRAADLLRSTLGDFLRVGLVDYDSSSSFSGSTLKQDAHLVPVYAPNVAFRVLAPPSEDVFASHATEETGAPTLAFSGRTWYFASAHILRGTLSVLFSEPHVALERLTLVDARSHPPQDAASGEQRHTPLPATLMPVAKGSAHRRHAIIVRLRFSGNLRVTGVEHNYTLRFRYDFDPATGQIASHVVERVEPAIGRKLWAGLSTVFLRLAGLSPNHPQPVRTSFTPRRSSLQFAPRLRSSVRNNSISSREFSTSTRQFEEAAPKQTQIGQIERRLSLTFTCTVEECGHRSAHEFSRRSYEKGIVIVQCPSCKNRHLIADHLSWFKDDGEARTVEAMVKEHGGRVRRGTSFGDADGGETIEIEFDSEAEQVVPDLEAASTGKA